MEDKLWVDNTIGGKTNYWFVQWFELVTIVENILLTLSLGSGKRLSSTSSLGFYLARCVIPKKSTVKHLYCRLRAICGVLFVIMAKRYHGQKLPDVSPMSFILQQCENSVTTGFNNTGEPL